jgi:hypothetical protein
MPKQTPTPKRYKSKIAHVQDWFFFVPLSYLYKIIGVCSQRFDSIICDWLDPPPLKAPIQSEWKCKLCY